MKARSLLTAAAVAIGLAGACAGHADDAKRSVGEYADDKLLVGKVKSALVSDEAADAQEINVEAYKGVVQLSGFVDGEQEKARAEAVAKGVHGVKGVQNNLAIKPSAQTVGGAIDDSTITARVKTALVRSPDTHALDIKVETRGGIVQLSGFVASDAEKAAASKVAGTVKGVKSVDNALAVK